MNTVARARSPRGELVLRRRPRGAENDAAGLELRVNGVFVLDTAETSSERALATLALAAVARPHHVLVAGLGLGGTLREVLADRRVRRVTLVELEASLVGWLRRDLVPGGGALLADPRVEVRVDDVRHQLVPGRLEPVDVVLLDVDNGPDHLVHQQNEALYQRGFLARCADSLTEHGALAVWSMSDSAGLAAALRERFADVRVHRCPVRLQGRKEAYWVSVASRPHPAGDHNPAAGPGTAD